MMSAAEDFLQRNRGVIRRADWLAEGLSLYSLYALKSREAVYQVCPGVYAAPDAMTRQEEIVQLLSRKHPRMVMNLLSALQFHQMTTQIPQALFLAMPRGARVPRISFCCLEVKRLLPAFMEMGAEVYQGTWGAFRVFNPERCVADLFRYRSEFGQDVFLEALHEYLNRKGTRPALLMEYAERLGVLKGITPYLETAL